MESRFARLRERDNSVAMLRVKMSRRRSQVQKENRERVVNTRRNLRSVAELETSALEASVVAPGNRSAAQKTKPSAKDVALQERMKQLQRWKDRKALEKEKENREKARKGVFKTGLYHPKDSLTPEPLPSVPGRAKVTKVNPTVTQSSRVTRSMKQQPVPMPLKLQDRNVTVQSPVGKTTRARGAPSKPAPARSKEPATRALPTRGAHRPPATAASALKDNPKDMCTDKTVPAPVENQDIAKAEVKQEEPSVPGTARTEEAPNTLPKLDSFAPENFLFQAPVGVSSFKFNPMTPRSADAFLTPSSSSTLPPPAFEDESKAEESEPSPPKSPRRSPPPAPTTEEHDVPYFRGEISNETVRLTDLCSCWEAKVDDDSIPEEMRDGMRTAVGQARLLMKERFHQFKGLVDDCEFSRGEKVTTCTDLQGFWDMVYFQVEDVYKKFEALKEAEARGWVEEHKPPPRQRKVLKKAAPAPPKPAGTKAAAKSRLAAAKAAMKARQAAESEKEMEQNLHEAKPAEEENTAKPPGSVRRSCRRSALAPPPPQSPSSACLTPRRVTRRSLALALTPNPQATTPRQSRPGNKTPAQAATPQVSRPFSPLKETSSVVPEQVECVSEPGRSLSTVEEREKPAEDVSQSIEEEKPAEDMSRFAEEEKPAEDMFRFNEEEKPAEDVCRSAEEPTTVSLSFCLSPCAVQTRSPQATAGPHPVSPQSRSATPDSSVTEDMPGVDFERYLQPSQRDSLSPRRPVAMESPLAMDVDMESPRGCPEQTLTQQETVSATLTSEPRASPSLQTAESDMLLFTPDIKDRIRQSRCPRDLMVFTPPL